MAPSSKQALLDDARASTVLSDFGPAGFHEGLDVLRRLPARDRLAEYRERFGFAS